MGIPKPNPIRLFSWGVSNPVVRNDIENVVGRAPPYALHVWERSFWASLTPILFRSGLGSAITSLVRAMRRLAFIGWWSSSSTLARWNGAGSGSPLGGVGRVVGVEGYSGACMGV